METTVVRYEQMCLNESASGASSGWPFEIAVEGGDKSDDKAYLFSCNEIDYLNFMDNSMIVYEGDYMGEDEDTEVIIFEYCENY